MKKKKQIVVLFGPSGSGKTFLANLICKNDSFSMIKKATNREIRTGGHFSFHVDQSVKYGGEKGGANYYDYIDGLEGDFLVNNYGKSYSIHIEDIDSALAYKKTPVIILRSREQFEELQNLYPDVEIVKFYLRPDIEKVKEKILNDKTRSSQNKIDRITALESDYEYHDQTVKLDNSVNVLLNDFSNGKELVEKVYNTLNITSKEELKLRKEQLDKLIVVGDKIRITKTNDYWHANVITDNKVKFSIVYQDDLETLLQEINKHLTFESQENFKKLDKKYEYQALTSLLDKNYALDISFNSLGIDYYFSRNCFVLDPDEDYDRDHDAMPYTSIGYKRCSSKVRTNDFGLDSIIESTNSIINQSTNLLTSSKNLSDIELLKADDNDYNTFAKQCVEIKNSIELET